MAETERNLPKSSGGGTVSNEENSASYFSNLPIGDLICTPFIELARGQAKLCEVYVQTLFKLAYVDAEKRQAVKMKRQDHCGFAIPVRLWTRRAGL